HDAAASAIRRKNALRARDSGTRDAPGTSRHLSAAPRERIHMGEQRNPNGSRTARPYGMTAGLKRTGLPYGRAHTASHGEATFMFDVRIIAACRRPQDAVQMCYRTTGGIVHPSITL